MIHKHTDTGNNRILVTGGAGFIGSHITRRLLDMNYQVTILDDLTTGDRDNIPENAEFIAADIAKEKTYRNLDGRKFSHVFHLAAQSSGEISDEKPEHDLDVNTRGTLLLLCWCREQKIPRFLYASSMAVYGDAVQNPVAESTPCIPLSFYGISKFASEQYIRHFSKKGLNTTIFRMFSVYGPGQNMTNLKQGMVSIFMAYLLKNEAIWVKGSGDRFRDFIYIDDVVDAWISAMDTPGTYGKTYNLATGKKTFVHELITEEIKTFNRDPLSYPVKYEGTTPSDQFGLYADISALRADTDWQPKTDLSTGLSRMVAWIRNKHLRDTERM